MKNDLARLKAWVEMRTGVEAFVEPRTSVTEPTVLLVAGDGEWTRTKVDSAHQASEFARAIGIPVYDANRVGYPRRMREYNVRVSQRDSVLDETTPVGLSPAQQRAVQTLARAAGIEIAGTPESEEIQKLWRMARSQVHPDRNDGDRTGWDEIEKAARTLNLVKGR